MRRTKRAMALLLAAVLLLTTAPASAAAENPFSDIASNSYYYNAVLWAYGHEPQITGGRDASHFCPMDICTRAQIVTFIWRANGCPEPEGGSKSFNDVFSGTYYYKAVLWAAENAITGGFDDGGFHPNELVTRAQAMTFLWRAEGYPEVPTGTVKSFRDVPVTAYYHYAVLWAVANGITGGYDASTFGPMDGCTRAQIVTFLYRCEAPTQEPKPTPTPTPTPAPTEDGVPSPGDTPTRENVLALLDKYDPDGAFILRAVDSPNFTVWLGSEIPDGVGTAVHEQCHAYSYPDVYSQQYYIGGGEAIRVTETKTYKSEEMAAQIPQEHRTFRYDDYVAAGSELSSNLNGIYGLMNEFTAYCWGSNTDVALYDYYLTQPVTVENWKAYIQAASSSYAACAEFKYYILSYMLYAKENYPAIYDELLANTALMNAFKTVEARFAAVIDEYFKNLDSLEVLLAENGFKTKHEDGYFWIYSGYYGQGVGTYEDDYYLLVSAMEAPEYAAMYETMLAHAG